MPRDGWRVASVVQRKIADAVAAEGAIPVAEFMTIALLTPTFGYYAQHDPIGARGDFVTAPEISQMFGELTGAWIADAWLRQGEPAAALLVELGPGRGTLMDDALRVIARGAPALFAQSELYLVEASAPLREAQAAKLRPHRKALQWRDSLQQLPAERPLFLIANEFFDALPIRQYVKTARGWCERMVTADPDGALRFVLSPVPAPDGIVPADRGGAPEGGFYEASPAGEAIAEEIAHRIARHGGAALIVDYGYDKPGFGETLQAVSKHAFADVLSDPGLDDLSAHVDFQALAAAARRGGADVFGPVGQGDLLTALGIQQRALRLGDATGLDRLTNPAQMGTLFKALAIVPKTAPAPAGFE